MDGETTHSLNKKFKIDGFRITKIKGVLCLKKDVKKKENNEVIEEENIKENIMERLEKLEKAVNDIIDALNGENH